MLHTKRRPQSGWWRQVSQPRPFLTIRAVKSSASAKKQAIAEQVELKTAAEHLRQDVERLTCELKASKAFAGAKATTLTVPLVGLPTKTR